MPNVRKASSSCVTFILSMLSDSERPDALIELVHPDFRDALRATIP